MLSEQPLLVLLDKYVLFMFYLGYCHEPAKLNLLLYYYPNHITHYYLIRIAYQSPAYAKHSITTRTAAQPMTTLQYQLTCIQVIE